MDTAHDLARGEQVLHIRLAVRCNVQTAVLIVERGIDQDRLRADIDAVLCKHAHHRWNSLFDRSLAALEFDHRRIQPHRVTQRGLDALVPLGAFANDGGRRHVARLEGVHERLALCVN